MGTCLGLDLKYKGKVGTCVGFGGGVSWVCYLKVTGGTMFLNLGTVLPNQCGK